MAEKRETIDLSKENIEKIEMDDSEYNLEFISNEKVIEIKLSESVFFALINFLKD